MPRYSGNHIGPLNLCMRNTREVAFAELYFAFIVAVPDAFELPPIEAHWPTPFLDQLIDAAFLLTIFLVGHSTDSSHSAVSASRSRNTTRLAVLSLPIAITCSK